MDGGRKPSKRDPLPRSRSAPVIERAPMPIVEVQGSAHIVSHVNPAFCRLLGKTKEELLGKPFAEIVQDGGGCVPILDRVYHTGEAATHVQQDASDPALEAWLYAMWPALDANERPEGVIIQLAKGARFRHDAAAVNEALLISGLRQHELTEAAEKLNAQLRAEIAERKLAEQKFRDLLESAPDAILITNQAGQITLINTQTEKLFGYARNELVGKPVEILIPKHSRENHPGHRHDFLAAPGTRPMGAGRELLALRKDGTEFPAEISLSPLETPDGLLIIAAVRDVTERNRTEKALRVAMAEIERGSRAKDDFLAALSHELRTPLTPVLMTASALREDESLAPHIREQLTMIVRNVALEARLIDDLLDVTRISRGKLVLRTEPCDIHSLIALVVEIVRGDAREKAISIEVELSAQRSSLTGDSTRLQQVFWNLLRNAVKFTPSGGHIHVRSHDEPSPQGGAVGSRLCIEVSDDGIGLDAAAMERIFEPFEQVSPDQKHLFGGLGLGLAIARAIVARHQGTMRAASAGLGLGSTFTVELPVTAASPSDPATTASPTAGTSHAAPPVAAPLRLLVVEDHEGTRQVLTRLLTRDGHHVVEAASLAAARAAATTQRFDAVISDLGLPDGTGIELMKELRTTHGLRGIVLSGYGMEEDLRRSREAGFVAHLVKPVDMNDLRRALRQFVKVPAVVHARNER